MDERGCEDATVPRVARVVTGGQSGVDRAATDVARAAGVPTGGWVPRGGWAEDHPRPPGLLTTYPEFRETDTDDPTERTRRNVDDAGATLVLRLDAAPRSPGTEATLARAAERGVPLGVIELEDPAADDALETFTASLPAGVVLNVAGPRESEQPGVYRAARALLERHARALFGPATTSP